MSAPRRSSGRGSATVRICLPASSDPKNCFGYMIERRAALFRVVRLPDGMITTMCQNGRRPSEVAPILLTGWRTRRHRSEAGLGPRVVPTTTGPRHRAALCPR
jgi:hypothetical protein